MAAEDFTTWTETDPDAKLSQTSTTASATALNSLSTNETYLRKDFGAGNWPGDYGPFRFEAIATAQSSSNGRGCFFTISPILPAVATGSVVYEQSTRVHFNNGTLYLAHWQDANNTFTADVSDSMALSLNTRAYCQIERASGVVTLKVYSDSGYSSLVDTLSISPANTYSHRYICVSAKHSSGSGATLTFDTANLDLSPTIGGGLSITSVTPSSFDSGKSVVLAGNGFGASQGSSTLTIGGQAQTITSWSNTSITFTSVRGSVSPGNATLTLTKV